MVDPVEFLEGSVLVGEEGLLVVFFLYGLGFMVLGSVVLAKKLRVESVDLTQSFYFLGAFGLLHGTMEWMDVGRLLAEVSGVPRPPALDVGKLVLLVASYVLLMQFGVNLLTLRRERFDWLRYVPVASGAGFLFVAAALGSYEQVLMAGRHSFGLVAPLLASIALLDLRRACEGERLRPLRRSAGLMAAGFGVYTVFSGVVTFPVAGVPPQVVRMVCALVIGYAAFYLLTELETRFGMGGAG